MTNTNKENIAYTSKKGEPAMLTFQVPTYKYSVELKEMQITLNFQNMTFMQRLFARWFLSGKITKLKGSTK